MREIYYALAAWHPAEFSVWVVSHSRILSRGNPLGSGDQAYWLAACTRQITSPSQGVCRVSWGWLCHPPTTCTLVERPLLVHDCLFVGRLPLISQLASISRGHSTIRHPWTRWVAVTALPLPDTRDAILCEMRCGNGSRCNTSRVYWDMRMVKLLEPANKSRRSPVNPPQLLYPNSRETNEDGTAIVKAA